MTEEEWEESALKAGFTIKKYTNSWMFKLGKVCIFKLKIDDLFLPTYNKRKPELKLCVHQNLPPLRLGLTKALLAGWDYTIPAVMGQRLNDPNRTKRESTG